MSVPTIFCGFFTDFLRQNLFHFSFKCDSYEDMSKYKVYLLCRWEKHLTEFPHLGVVDRWLATRKRARIAQ